MGGVEDLPDAQARLADLIEKRRLQMGLSTSAAAREARIDRATWSSAEKGARLRDYNLTAIERVLRWAPGSIEEILVGGDPVLLAEGEVYDEEMAIIDRAPVSEAAKERMRDRLRELRDRDRQQRMSDIQWMIDREQGA